MFGFEELLGLPLNEGLESPLIDGEFIVIRESALIDDIREIIVLQFNE